MEILLVIVWLALLASCVFVFFRNNAVYRYRVGLLDEISTAAKVDIDNRREWKWRYDAWESVSYYEQLFKFWRRLDDFYPDKSFVDSSATR